MQVIFLFKKVKYVFKYIGKGMSKLHNKNTFISLSDRSLPRQNLSSTHKWASVYNPRGTQLMSSACSGPTGCKAREGLARTTPRSLQCSSIAEYEFNKRTHLKFMNLLGLFSNGGTNTHETQCFGDLM